MNFTDTPGLIKRRAHLALDQDRAMATRPVQIIAAQGIGMLRLNIDALKKSLTAQFRSVRTPAKWSVSAKMPACGRNVPEKRQIST